jgi:hypothetical protein
MMPKLMNSRMKYLRDEKDKEKVVDLQKENLNLD